MNNYIWYETLNSSDKSGYEIRGKRFDREGHRETRTVTGLTTDYKTALYIAELLQDYQVSLIHMEDVITDILQCLPTGRLRAGE